MGSLGSGMGELRKSPVHTFLFPFFFFFFLFFSFPFFLFSVCVCVGRGTIGLVDSHDLYLYLDVIMDGGGVMCDPTSGGFYR